MAQFYERDNAANHDAPKPFEGGEVSPERRALHAKVCHSERIRHAIDATAALVFDVFNARGVSNSDLGPARAQVRGTGSVRRGMERHYGQSLRAAYHVVQDYSDA